jgi:hypothetical protein
LFELGLDDENEAIDGADVNGGTGIELRRGYLWVAKACLPDLPAYLNLAYRRQRRADDGKASDHGLRTSEDLVAVRTKGDPGKSEGDDSEAKACGHCGGDVYALLGDRAID